MSIELRVPFFEKEDALEFQRYLKKNGCSGRLETSLDFRELMKYSATIANLEKFLDEREKQDGNEPFWEDEKEDIEEARTWVNNYKKYLADFYAKCEVGKEYPSLEHILNTHYGIDTDIISSRSDELDDAEMKKRNEVLTEVSHVIAVKFILEKNDCLTDDQESDKIILTQKKPIEELVVTIVGDGLLGGFDHEDMKSTGISISMQTQVECRYTVIAGPEYITLDLDDLIEYLSDYDDNEDEEDNDAIIHVRMCSVLIRRIMDIIHEGPVSTSELIEKLFASTTDIPITFDVFDDALSEILNDMKKLGMITIKNGLVKLSK